MAELAIRARGLGKRYRKGADTHGRLIHWLRYRGRADHLWALQDLDLDVPTGEMLGVIGANGAGKSTLLKILSRITRPNSGEVMIQGRVGSLLEVGTGFHPELTGRENVYLNGALIGMSRTDVRHRFDEIVAFSGIEEFLDTPLKRYSSGMQIRLGFAIAVNLQQDIMLVDEVLSVGDAAFRERCLAKMDEVTGHGRTVLFVGHNLEMVRASCHRVVWLDHGRVRAEGKPEEVVQAYEDFAIQERTSTDGFIPLSGVSDHRPEDSPISLTHIRLLGSDGHPVSALESAGPGSIALGYEVHAPAPVDEVSASITFMGSGQNAIGTCDSAGDGETFASVSGKGELRCVIDRLALVPGRYRIGVRCHVGDRVMHSIPNAAKLTVAAEASDAGRPPRGSGALRLQHRWEHGRQDETKSGDE